MRGPGQPHGGAEPSAELTPRSEQSRAGPGIFRTVLPKGVSPVHHHLSAFQQHTPGKCSEQATTQRGLAMGWQSWRERSRTWCQAVICLPGLVTVLLGSWWHQSSVGTFCHQS